MIVKDYKITYNKTEYDPIKRKFSDKFCIDRKISAYNAEDAIVQADVCIKNQINYHSHIITNIEPIK